MVVMSERISTLEGALAVLLSQLAHRLPNAFRREQYESSMLPVYSGPDSIREISTLYFSMTTT